MVISVKISYECVAWEYDYLTTDKVSYYKSDLQTRIHHNLYHKLILVLCRTTFVLIILVVLFVYSLFSSYFLVLLLHNI